MRKGKAWERAVEIIFFICALFAILSVVLITLYIFIKGAPLILKIGIIKFIFGMKWNPDPSNGLPSFGILPFVLSSVLATIGAVIIGVSVGLFNAIFLAELAPTPLVKIFKPAVELLAGIPSVVYGFFGLAVIVPIIRENLGGRGFSLLAAIIILSVMILPTIINISAASIKAVPVEYKEGSLALGATHMQTIIKTIIPAAKSGIMASIILGTGRAIGETMAVILVSGNSTLLPESLLSPIRTLTANIALEMGYASGDHENALFATGVVLFVFIMLLNTTFSMLIHKKAGVQNG